MAKNKWSKIKDEDVRTVWKCPECGDKASVSPDFFQESGTPVCCNCDKDMDYLHTQILREVAYDGKSKD